MSQLMELQLVVVVIILYIMSHHLNWTLAISFMGGTLIPWQPALHLQQLATVTMLL